MFKDVPSSPDFPALEAETLDYWRDQDIPAKAQTHSRDGKRPYVFYEGPPTANGRPGIHHVSARAVKDSFCRFKTMQGHRVDRRAGWDTHGLPVEIEVEKEIGSKTKSDIEAFGIAEFNAKCKDSVFRYIGDWVKLTERIGFWLDFDRAYITYDRNYIETEWWILKNLWDRGLLFQDFKTTMHCTRCNTSLADHEVSQGMKEDVDDPSVSIKFDVSHANLLERGLIDAGETRPVSLLIWTTTPWTLGANVAIGVAPDTPYALVLAPPFHGAPEEAEKELFIVADALADSVFEEGRFERLKLFPSSDLKGLSYNPVLTGQTQSEGETPLYQVFLEDSVEISTGTGVLHIAPAYGDLAIGQKNGLSVLFSAGRDGQMLPDVRLPHADPSEDGPFTGTFFKSADKDVTRTLRAEGRLYRGDRIKHAYPHCWRDDTPLMHLAKSSWYLRTTAVKDKLLSNNQAINWYPDHVKDGRFGRWLEGNIDWAISRERFWGCPLPIWIAEDGEAVCVGSFAELAELCGRPMDDLDPHRPFVDDITFEKDGKTFRRVPDTIDVWFDSGAMPYAQWHYPFENKEEFENQFPADFISEAMDQTRGWFYSLHAIATLLTYGGDDTVPAGPLADRWPNESSFRNVVSQGFINDEKDRKMSKSRGNTVDPWEVLSKEGCDALRWYILSNAPPGKNLAFKRGDITKQSLKLFLVLWNVYSFFVTYANLSKPDLSQPWSPEGKPEFDRWMEAKRHDLIVKVTAAMEDFDASTAIDLIAQFIDRDLSQWYLRGNRRRFWGGLEEDDAQSAFQVMYNALLTVAKLMAPIAPYLPETIYRNLGPATGDTAPSVHLSNWPEADPALIDTELLETMTLVVDVVHLGRSARVKSKIKVRQPLRCMHLRVRSAAEQAIVESHGDLIRDELNIRAIDFVADSQVRDFADFQVRPNFATLSQRLGPKLAAMRKQLGQAEVQGRIVSAIIANEGLELDLDGEAERFSPDDFLLGLKDRGGLASAFGDGLMVALETTLDDELIEEGKVRELLRRIQDARQRAGLAVSDRIVLRFAGAEAAAMLEAHGMRLSKELLAEDLAAGELEDALVQEELEFGEATITMAFRKA